MPKKVLIIPHSAYFGLRIRLTEIAKVLAAHYETYILTWHEPKEGGLIEKVSLTFKDILKKSKVYEKENLYFAEYPFFHRPFFMTKLYNPYSLEQFLIKHEIDVVINGVHYFFPTPRQKKYKCTHIFDVSDLPTEEVNSHLGHFMYEFAKREILKADAVTACSRGLVDYIQDSFSCQAHYIPNGTHLEEFSKVNMHEAKQIRQRYGVSDKFIIGYIGYVGDWIDLDFLINFFRRLRDARNNVALMVVGGGPKIEFYKKTIKDKDIIFTGAVHQDKINTYFSLIDAGVLPSKKCLFQDVAFHIKLIEYTAAKKMVISSPLDEVKRLGFPNILIASFLIEEWIQAIEKIRQIKWNHEWDKWVSDYDWGEIGNKFIDIIER